MTFLTHGRIVGGTATVPDLDAALADYRDTLGLGVVEHGTLAADLTGSWGALAITGARYAVLQPASGVPSFLRLVEQPVPAGFAPTRTFGWAAFEFTVQDVYDWPTKLTGSGFDIIGPPKEIPGLPYFVAMQMLGRGREMIYLNEVRQDTPSSDLPRAACPIDHIFIVILACADRPAALAWYRDTLGLDIGGDYTIEPRRVCRRLQLLRGWSDDKQDNEQVCAGSSRASSADGAGTRARPCIAMGGGGIDRG